MIYVAYDLVQNKRNADIFDLILQKGADIQIEKNERLYYILMTKVPTYAAQLITVLINESCLPSAVLCHTEYHYVLLISPP